MIYTMNLMALPFVLAIWAIDAYVLLVCVRLISGRLSGPKAMQLCSWLKPLTDPLPQAAGRWLRTRMKRVVPRWLPWLVTILLLSLVREVLVLLVIT